MEQQSLEKGLRVSEIGGQQKMISGGAGEARAKRLQTQSGARRWIEWRVPLGEHRCS